MAGDRFKNSLQTAKNLGSFTTNPQILQDTVGKLDRNDLSRFHVANRASLTLNLSLPQSRKTSQNQRGTIGLDIFAVKAIGRKPLQILRRTDFVTLKPRDLRNKLTFLSRSKFSPQGSRSLSLNLEPGEYYFRVYSNGQNSPYRVLATLEPLAEPTPPTPVPAPIPTPTPDPSGTPSPTPTPTPAPTPLPTLKLDRSWIRQFGSSANDYLYGLALSQDGNNLYVSGSTNGNLIDPSTGQTVGTNAGDRDSFTAQYSITGNPQWVRQFGRPDLDVAYNLAVDGAGNYYTAGIDIVSGTLPNPNGYLAKFNNAGIEQLPRKVINTQVPNPISNFLPPIDAGDALSAVAIDASGDLVVAGFVAAVPSISPAKAWVAKYDGTTGTQEWQKELSLPRSSGVSALKLDQEGNIYVTGITNATIQNNPSNPFEGGDIFIAKLNSSGTTLWEPKILATSEQDEARGIAIDQTGNIYVTGNTRGTFVGQNSVGDTDGFLTKYDTSGNLQWLKQFGTSGLDESQAIAVDSTGTIYLTGETTGSLFGNTPLGQSDAWIATFDNSGNLTASTIVGTPDDEETYNITLSSAGKIYVVGQTQGNIAATQNQGGYDAWIAEYTLSS